MLRRRKRDVLTDLPDKIEQVLEVELSDQQRKRELLAGTVDAEAAFAQMNADDLVELVSEHII